MSTYVIQILTGIAGGAILFLVASGLTLVFGALRIANFAHGSLFMLGAFLMYSLTRALGSGESAFWIGLAVAALAVAAVGAVMEIVCFRPIYRRSLLTQLLVTFGLVLVIDGVLRGIYGAQPHGINAPPSLSGSMAILGGRFPVYQFFLICLAGAIVLVLWLLLYRTAIGQMIRAAVADPQLLSLSGIRVSLLFTGVFVIGALFAGLAGGAIASQGAVAIGMDIDVIVKAFVVIVIGGMGSLAGAFIGSMLVGLADSLGVLWLPNSSLVAVFAVLVVVLAVRPQGLIGHSERLDTIGPLSLQLARSRAARLAARLRRQLPLPSASPPAVERTLWLAGAVAIVVAGLLPYIVPAGTVLTAQLALVYALFALSLNLLVGTSGLMSFGHAAYFGFGAYTVALLVERAHWPPVAALAVAPLVGAAAAALGGLIALRATALYFALLTLGLAQLSYAVALGWTSLTDGSNGVHGTFTPSWLFDLDDLYWFLFGCVLLCTVLLYVVTRSPFGDALRAIRENRRRAEFSGLWVKAYELGAFVVAGAFAAVAGGLFTFAQGQAYTELFFWTASALPLISGLIGGIGWFLGPAVGAFFYTFLNDSVAQQTQYWDAAVGTVVVLVALLLPGGLVGAFRSLAVAALAGARYLAPHERPAEVVRAEPPPP